MKRNTLLIIGLLFTVFTSGFSQGHIVKLGIPSLSYGRANLNYEYVLNDKMSLNLRVGAQFPRNFPADSETFFEEDLQVSYNIESGKWTSYGFMPSFRIYMGEKNPAPHGFYVSPYLSYNNNALNFSMEYSHEGEANIPANFKVAMGTIGAGIMIGNQWVIKDRVVIDFNYLGIGYGLRNYSMKFVADDENIDYEELEEIVNEVIDDSRNTGGSIKPKSVKSFDDGIKVAGIGSGLQLKCSFSVGYKF